MKGMKRKFFLKRMWNFVVVMLIPTLLLVAVVALCAIVFLAYVNTKRSFD